MGNCLVIKADISDDETDNENNLFTIHEHDTLEHYKCSNINHLQKYRKIGNDIRF